MRLGAIIVLLLFHAACGRPRAGARPSAPDQPNVIVIMTDDQGYGDLGATGNPVLSTPHLDRMANRSASLDRFYVSPVCTPTRASLMTGRYAQRTRAFDTWVGRAQMEPGEVTIAEVLRDAGYTTGIFGKWHLGDCYPMRAIDQGFDEALVHRGGGLGQPSEPIENNRRYTDPILFRNGEPVQTDGYCTDVYFDSAISFIERSNASGRPFFGYIATNAPHDPLHDVPEELRRKYASMDLSVVVPGPEPDARTTDRVARVFAMIENIDDNVGRLFGALDRLGITDDTIVLFMMDNGPSGRRYCGPFRGSKGGIHEGGIRSVCYLHHPPTFGPGDRTDALSAHIDVMPTLLDAAGVAPPDNVRLDGRSMLGQLRGEPAPPGRTIVIQSHRGDAPVPWHHACVITDRYKLLHPTGFGRESFEPADTPIELYDIRADPGETRDLADARPDIVASLRSVYDAWFDDIRRTREDPFSKPRIVIGTDEETTTVLTPQDWERTGQTGWGDQGRWLLRVASPERFDCEVIRSKPDAGVDVALDFGGTIVNGRFEAGARRAQASVTLGSGDVDLVTRIGGSADHGAYQVVLRRVRSR